ncbi:MAG: type II secretion system minor pseudopilin GspK [Pseudomonadota bacterium]
MLREPLNAQHQRGAVALIFALLYVAIIASFVATISYNIALDIRRTQSLLQQEQARHVALGAEDWIASVLRDDLSASATDHPAELWAQPLPPLPIEGSGGAGFITGQIVDLQSRFNLNNLIDANNEVVQEEMERFQLLLELLGIDIQLAEAVVDWMDVDSDVRFPGGAEEDTYAARVPALRTANMPFRSAAEIAVVEGFTTEMVTALLPHITALPERTGINANTAGAVVLTSLDRNLTQADAERLVALSQEQGGLELQVDFAGLLPEPVIGTLVEQTSYFQITSVVRIGSVRFAMYSLLYRDPQGQTAVLLRSFGNPF